MFALILYTASKTTDIVKKEDIKYPKDGKGDVNVLHGHKYYKAKIVKESDNMQWLETLSVSEDGKVSLGEKSASKSDKGTTAKARIRFDTATKRNAAKKVDVEVLEKSVALRKKPVEAATNEKKTAAIVKSKKETVVVAEIKKKPMITRIEKQMNKKSELVDSDSDEQQEKVESSHQEVEAEKSKVVEKKPVEETKADTNAVNKSTMKNEHNAAAAKKKKTTEVTEGTKETVVAAGIKKRRMTTSVEKRLNKKRKFVDSESDEELAEIKSGHQAKEAELHDEEDETQDETTGVDDHEIASDEEKGNEEDNDIDGHNTEDDEYSEYDAEEAGRIDDCNEEGRNGANNGVSVKRNAEKGDDEDSRPSKKQRHLAWLNIMAEQLPPISADTVKYFKFVAGILETEYEEQAKTNASKIDDIAGHSRSPNLIGMSSIGSDSKIELQRNSGIFLEKAELENVLEFNDNPRSMVRRLMRLIVGEAELRKMSAGGRSQRPGIPREIKKVVFKFVKKNTAEGVAGLTSREYTRTLNLMCSTLRSQAKTTALLTGQTASATGVHQASPPPS